MRYVLWTVFLACYASAAPTFGEAKDIWLSSCGTNLDIAFKAFGSKKSYNNARERTDVIKEVCSSAVEAQTKYALAHPKLSIESHACLYLAERGDLVRGFEDHGDNSMEFVFGRCNKL